MATSTMKEFFRLMRDVNKFTDGQVDVYLDEDQNENRAENETDEENEDSSLTFFLDIKPNDGYYMGGKIKFKVVLEDYPDGPPNVTCCNVIYHPNIDLTEGDNYGSVCVNLLGSDWTPEVGLDGCVMSLLFLFYNPQLDDALSPVFSGSDDCNDLETFAENVQLSMSGGEIDGYIFDNILINEYGKDMLNGENSKPDEGECESSDISTENNKASSSEEVLDTINTCPTDKDVESKVEKENESNSDKCENGEELNKTDLPEPIKDETNNDTGSFIPIPVDVAGSSNIIQDSNASSTTRDVENTNERTSEHEKESAPLVSCDILDNKITDSCSLDNENVASSSLQERTDMVLNVQGAETDHNKTDHRQSIVKYIKSKLNVFSGFFKLASQCKGILPRR